MSQSREPMFITKTVVIDLRDLNRRSSTDDVRNRLWNVVQQLPAGTAVDLYVGANTPLPLAVDDLDLDSVHWSLKSASQRALDAWEALLAGERVSL